ncbi:MAG: molecular chaperone TorD family protein [Hydrogenophilus sp.]|nr:molecular chaperone TorD family protein [Hydrogenophilus sp.]
MADVKPLEEWFTAVAEDAAMLARLHATELDASTWEALHESSFPDCLGLLPSDPEFATGWQAMREALDSLPRRWEEPLSTALAADFASTYCNNRFHANPHASAWLDEDGLLFQRAMFDLRQVYRKLGVQAAHWRTVAEDHIAAQLHFTALLAARSPILSSDQNRELWCGWGEALEVYLLSWLKRFIERIAYQAETPFYPALGLLTWGWVETLRSAITQQWGHPRLSSEELNNRLLRIATSKTVTCSE